MLLDRFRTPSLSQVSALQLSRRLPWTATRRWTAPSRTVGSGGLLWTEKPRILIGVLLIDLLLVSTDQYDMGEPRSWMGWGIPCEVTQSLLPSLIPPSRSRRPAGAVRVVRSLGSEATLAQCEPQPASQRRRAVRHASRLLEALPRRRRRGVHDQGAGEPHQEAQGQEERAGHPPQGRGEAGQLSRGGGVRDHPEDSGRMARPSQERVEARRPLHGGLRDEDRLGSLFTALNQRTVCVNPYHYERIESPPGLPGFDGQHFPNAGSPLAAPPAANLNGMLHQNGELNGDANPFAQFTLEALRALAFQTNLGSLDLGSAAALLSNPLFFNPSPQASIFPVLPESLQSMEMEESQAPLDEGQEAPMYHEKKGPLGQSFELERGHDYLTLGMAPGTGPTYDISGIENPERTEGAARARQWLSEGGVTVMIRNRSILLRSTLSRPVFVRSPYLNRQVHADLSSPSPHHVYSGSDLTIFVIDDFRHAINDYVKQVMSTRFDLGDNDHQDEEEPGQGTSSSCNGSHPPATKKQRTEAEKPRMEVDCDALLRTCATFEVGLAENELGSHPARIEDFECWFQFTVCQLGLEVERAVEVLA
uniref:MH2 domain-containing protein n=1 Tax=Steinernema glaseri TaxID=37863 RepID=A0A1I8A7D8_9BILA